MLTAANPNSFAAYDLLKMARATSFLPIDSSNLGLSGKKQITKNERALEQLPIKMYIRQGLITIRPNNENSQLLGIMNSPINPW